MDTNQEKIIELLSEAHLLACKEMERLNMRIAGCAVRRDHAEEGELDFGL
jgi:hypothetical protein